VTFDSATEDVAAVLQAFADGSLLSWSDAIDAIVPPDSRPVRASDERRQRLFNCMIELHSHRLLTMTDAGSQITDAGRDHLAGGES
jgi:hypothetical protein